MSLLTKARLALAVLLALMGSNPHNALASSFKESIAEIEAEIAEKGSATVLVQLVLPRAENSMASPAETPSDRVQMIESRRALVADAKTAVRAQLANQGIDFEQEYRNLPVFLTTVNQEQLKHLAANPQVNSIILNKAARAKWTPNNIGIKAAPRTGQSEGASTRSAAHYQSLDAQERSQRQQAALNDDPATPQINTTTGYINADDVWNQGFTGQGQVVVVMDDGIDADHDMFAGKIATEACFSDEFDSTDQSLCANGSTSQTGTGAASFCPSAVGACSHGSHVAGIAVDNDTVGTVRRGVAYDAELIPIQIFTQIDDPDFCDGEDSCAAAYTSSTLGALNHVIDLATTYNIASVNMSIGGSQLFDSACDDDLRKSAIDTLLGLDIASVISAGNDGSVGSVNSPGCISSAVTVSSVIITVPDSDVNHSPLVDLLAPGVLIQSADVGNSYSISSGTSMAAPHVAGSFALLKSAKPTASALEIEATLKNTGIPETRLDWTWETPRIDLAAAFSALETGTFLNGTIVGAAFASTTQGAESFIRFYNPNSSAGTVNVEIVDDITAEIVGSWSASIPRRASLQFSMQEIEQQAEPQIIPVAGSSQSYSLYVTSTFSGFVQHVLWNQAGASLTNVSGCQNGLSNSVTHMGNIHTSLINGYPSFIIVHNSGETAANPDLSVYDARDGDFIGSFNLTDSIPAHTTVQVFMSDIVEFFGSEPEAGQNHVNVVLDSGFDGFMQHVVDNEGSGVLTNMSAKCAL